MDDDLEVEQMAEDVYEAMKPLQEWLDKLKEAYTDLPEWIEPTFTRSHEDTEMLLMKLLDKYYGNGFKDGAADERYTREMAELQNESNHPRASR